MYLNPENMPRDYQARIVRWLTANGCRDIIALEPITVRGNIAEYASARRPGRHCVRTGHDGWPELVTRRRRLRIRIPLQEVT